MVDEVIFQPSPLQQNLKAQFWARFQPSPFDDKDNVSLPMVQSYVGDARLKKYWDLPGFKEWFTNQDENRERVEYLWMLGLDTAEKMLRDDQVQPAAKVNLLKLLAEVTGKINRGKSGGEEKFADDRVNQMSKEELRSWLQKKGVNVKAEFSVKPRDEEIP